MRILIRLATMIGLIAWTGLTAAEQVTVRMWMHEHPPRISIDKAIIAASARRRDRASTDPPTKFRLMVMKGRSLDPRRQCGLSAAFRSGGIACDAAVRIEDHRPPRLSIVVRPVRQPGVARVA